MGAGRIVRSESLSEAEEGLIVTTVLAQLEAATPVRAGDLAGVDLKKECRRTYQEGDPPRTIGAPPPRYDRHDPKQNSNLIDPDTHMCVEVSIAGLTSKSAALVADVIARHILSCFFSINFRVGAVNKDTLIVAGPPRDGWGEFRRQMGYLREIAVQGLTGADATRALMERWLSARGPGSPSLAATSMHRPAAAPQPSAGGAPQPA